ncbi:MAG: hypothetical protein ACFE78_07480 [Candidatus Hodarchaeota archaeon]
MINNIKVFKLTYSGNLEEISQENILKNFTLFDILTFYLSNQRRIYVWISKKAPQSLKRHIPSIREVFLKDYPNLKILRNITVEFGSEPMAFFEAIEISEKEYRDYLSELETKMLPVLSGISRLKDEADKNFIAEKYEKSITFAQKIIELAKEVDDKSLEMNLLNFIEEAKSKAKAKKVIEQIENECKIKMQIFDNLNKAEKYKEAHEIVMEFRKKYERDYNLFSISIAQELLLKDENMLYNLKQEQQLLKEKIDILEGKIEGLISINKLYQAERILEESKGLTEKIFDKEIINKWDSLKNDYLKIKEIKKKEIEELNEKAFNFLNKRNLLEAMDIYNKIIDRLEQYLE